MQIQLKPRLSVSKIGKRRFWIGILAGFCFASSFHLASVTFARAAFELHSVWPEMHVERIRANNDWRREQGGPLLPEPQIVGPLEADTPKWFEPFWALLSAVFGQAIALSIWFWRPISVGSALQRNARKKGRSVVNHLMWVGAVPLLVGYIWYVHIVLVYAGNVSASAFGRPIVDDPLVPLFPFGVSAFLLVLIVALAPWQSLRRAYKCQSWTPRAILLTFLSGIVLFLIVHYLPFPFTN